jgi:hypothetical protein
MRRGRQTVFEVIREPADLGASTWDTVDLVTLAILGSGNNMFCEYRARSVDPSLTVEDLSAGLNGLLCFIECAD